MIIIKKLILFFIKKKINNINRVDSKINNHLKKIILPYGESIIIGNGPSLNDFFYKNKSFLIEKNLFCVNSFINTDFFLDVKPGFCILVDPYYWRKTTPSNIIAEFNIANQTLKYNVDWSITLILPEDAKLWNWFIDVPSINKNVNIIYFKNINIGLDDSDDNFSFYKEFEKFPHFQNVLVAALFFSLNFGSKINYLIGADMDLHLCTKVNFKNELCYLPSHFYKDDIKSMPMFKDNGIDIFKISEYFNALSLMFRGFEVIETYSKYLNAKVFNLTQTSYIDSFERKII